MRGSDLVRWTAKVAFDGPGGCWLWMASTTSDGYGNFFYAGRSTTAHRASYRMHVGPIPNGLHLDHLCRVRACVNPAHLEPVTVAENTRRARVARSVDAEQAA